MLPDLSRYLKVTTVYKTYDARYDARDAQSVQRGSRGHIRLEDAQLEPDMTPRATLN